MSVHTKNQKPVLIIQHAAHEHPAALRRALESQGISSLLIKIDEKKKLLKSNEISGLISLGGPMGANDEADYPWILDEIALMKGCFDKKIPIAGICLGGQILARALGGRVQQNTHPEIGWFEVKVNENGLKDPLFGATGKNPHFYQWHYDTFHPPKEAQILAESPLCERQAFKMNEHTYGFQFHPEADHQLVDEWLNIEGTDEEILLARIAHHQECVQLPDEHRNKAKTGEKFSLTFVAALGQMFQNEAYATVDSILYEQSLEFIQSKKECLVKFSGSCGNIIPLLGTIDKIVEIPQGKFIFVKEKSSLVWPIRLDHLVSIE